MEKGVSSEKGASGEELKTVFIPARPDHAGVCGMYVTVEWKCPVCGKPRGEPFKTRSYDGSRILGCDGWVNPCGHIDKYDNVRKEYQERVCARVKV